MKEIVFLNNKYKNKKNGNIYYTLDRVIDKTEKKDKIFILYGDFPISGNELHAMRETQFLEEFEYYKN